MILMKAADEASECLVRAFELSRLSICVFAGHHGTCPFKMRFAHTIRFQIHYVFNIVRVSRNEFRCVDFQAS
jgi:hypothetical protein